MPEKLVCRCRGDCGLHQGDCGKLVEKPHDVATVDEGTIGEWYKSGLCEYCWDALKAGRKL